MFLSEKGALFSPLKDGPWPEAAADSFMHLLHLVLLKRRNRDRDTVDV